MKKVACPCSLWLPLSSDLSDIFCKNMKFCLLKNSTNSLYSKVVRPIKLCHMKNVLLIFVRGNSYKSDLKRDGNAFFLSARDVLK